MREISPEHTFKNAAELSRFTKGVARTSPRSINKAGSEIKSKIITRGIKFCTAAELSLSWSVRSVTWNVRRAGEKHGRVCREGYRDVRRKPPEFSSSRVSHFPLLRDVQRTVSPHFPQSWSNCGLESPPLSKHRKQSSAVGGKTLGAEVLAKDSVSHRIQWRCTFREPERRAWSLQHVRKTTFHWWYHCWVRWRKKQVARSPERLKAWCNIKVY